MDPGVVNRFGIGEFACDMNMVCPSGSSDAPLAGIVAVSMVLNNAFTLSASECFFVVGGTNFGSPSFLAVADSFFSAVLAAVFAVAL